MTPLILFYNLSNEKGKKIRLICLKLHIRIKQVDPVDYAKPIGMLAGIKDFPAPQDDASFSSDPKRKAFTDEMLVMKDFDGRLLDRFLLEMRRAKIARVSLKAVLTPDNITWNSFALHDELQKEHEAMTKEPPSAT